MTAITQVAKLIGALLLAKIIQTKGEKKTKAETGVEQERGGDDNHFFEKFRKAWKKGKNFHIVLLHQIV